MPINPKSEYLVAERNYRDAKTTKDKIKALEIMLRLAPHHKGAEKLLKQIKTNLSKFRKLELRDKELKRISKKSKYQISIKKEGAAQLVVIGFTNTGKSTLLTKLTNAKPLVASYKFTTKKPEVGVMDYKGVKVQVVEIPAITENFEDKEKGPLYLAIIKQADLVVLMFNNEKERKILEEELWKADINSPKFYFEKEYLDDLEKLKETIWRNLNLIYVYTKTPGKEKDLPPVAMKKNSTVKDLALIVHKDFVKNFRFARVWGKSAKHNGALVSLNHKLEEGDIVEFHLK